MVVPGSFLSTEEEFLPGENSYVSSDGRVYSDSVGVKATDHEEKAVNVVKKGRALKLVTRSCIAFCSVVLVKDQSVVVDIMEAYDPQNESTVVVFKGLNATLPVFSVANSYVKDLKELFKIGDILKCRVDNVSEFGIDLETKTDDSLGVVKAFCTVCRQPLKLVEANLKCSSCGSNEIRKISSDYLVLVSPV